MNAVDFKRLFETKHDPSKVQKKVSKWKAYAQANTAQKLEYNDPPAVYEPSARVRPRRVRDDSSVVYESSERARQREMDEWRQNQERDRALIDALRQMHGLTDRDNVQIFIVPKGQNRIQPGSFITRPTTSPRAEELTRLISRNRTLMQELKIGIQSEDLTDDQKSARINSLRNTISTNERDLHRERARIATLPRSGWIIVERDS